MEALTATPRALFSPAAAPIATAVWTRRCCVRAAAAAAAEPAGEKAAAAAGDGAAAPKKVLKKKPVYSMKKGQIVRVDKDKYLNSINYLSVGHPPYYKGLDYIYEDRGEIAWVGIPTPPAWLPTYMLIKSDKLDYERI
ncbi:hypothetical protein PR202_gb03675 [Eleusine coracana subsp. coracana]|uniref:Uncharacterized protein n=1 Tax=Eleusine coracana subsp. coracana TaxID=191504 RepID=A0AAV5E2H5_ELECO|nr:hypothetical protein PR202_gb03675 [Eleusine coracana subsp. coracana]